MKGESIMAIVTLTAENFNDEVLNTNQTVLIDFWASWCGPCKMLSPIIDELAQEVSSDVKICKLNVDDERELAMEFQVRSIPTLVIIRDGKVVTTSVGVKSKAEILSMLNM